MALTKSLGAYADIRPVLDAAIARRGGHYILPTAQAAIRWAQRAYYYRTLLREQSRLRLGIEGIEPTTPYDEIKLRREDNIVYIEFYTPIGTFIGPDGNAVDVKGEALEAQDDLLSQEAEAFAKGLFGDE